MAANFARKVCAFTLFAPPPRRKQVCGEAEFYNTLRIFFWSCACSKVGMPPPPPPIPFVIYHGNLSYQTAKSKIAVCAISNSTFRKNMDF
jgi:hypothetical protein